MRDGIEGIAFDLDGTLYPNYRLNLRLIPYILRDLRLIIAFGKARSVIRKEQENPSYSCGDFYAKQAELTAEFLRLPGGEARALQEKIDKCIYKSWEPLFLKIKLFKGAAETLDSLKKAGYKLGLLSDFTPETKLEHLGLSGLWDAVLCSERCGALKPHPLSFQDLAKAMSLPCEKILYVGNSHAYDVAGAAGAGMKTALIKPVFRPLSGKKPAPYFCFSSYRQLRDFMIN